MKPRMEPGRRLAWPAFLMTAVLCSPSSLLTPAQAASASPHAAQVSSASTNRGTTPKDQDAQVAVRWFDLLYQLIQTERLSPPVASRAIGYAGVALYEAVAPGTPGRVSLAGQLNGLPSLPGSEPHRKCDWQLVAHAALNGTIRGLFAQASDESKAAIDALDQQLSEELRQNVPPPVADRSLELGSELAAAILAWASGDQFAQLNNCAYTPPEGEGMWVPTPPLLRPALQPCWGQLRPFVLHSGSECGAAPPPAYSTDSGSDFYAEAFEVYDTTEHPTAEQTAIAMFWADNPGETGTPPGHWISIVGQIARQRNLSLDTTSEAYARVGLAVADAFISSWNTKFIFNLLRPITYIQQNIDADWTSPIATPPFPEYTSGHSVQSGAAATVLTDLLGKFPFTDDTHVSHGLPARSFDSFAEAAAEAAMSRLYGGIHYRSAIERGIQQGECIGGRIEERVHFRESSPARH